MAMVEPTHFLYHFPYSICSIMVRYSYALRGEARDPKQEIRLGEQQVDIFKGEQLTEHYLCDVNPAGEVPVIQTTDRSYTLPDSLEITKYLASFYPSLIPDWPRQEIERLLKSLHTINFFALSYAGRPESQLAAKRFLEKQLDSSPSARYEEAILRKLQRIDGHKLGALEGDNLQANEQFAREVMLKIASTLDSSKSPWCFGLAEPSALDAHLVVFIARLFDVDRSDLIPSGLSTLGRRAMSGSEWQEVMQGRQTHMQS